MNAAARKRLRLRLVIKEHRLIDYFRRNLSVMPDGSFMAEVWRLGYEAARREMKKQQKKGCVREARD